MWKTPGRFWAQIGPFAHILPSKTAGIHCAAVGLDLFRRPQGVTTSLKVTVLGGDGVDAAQAAQLQGFRRKAFIMSSDQRAS